MVILSRMVSFQFILRIRCRVVTILICEQTELNWTCQQAVHHGLVVWAVSWIDFLRSPFVQLKWSLSLKRDVSFYGKVNSVWTMETSQIITLGHFPINIVGFSGLKPISKLTLELSGWFPDYWTCGTWSLDSLALNVFFRQSMLGAIKRLLPIRRGRIDIS